MINIKSVEIICCYVLVFDIMISIQKELNKYVLDERKNKEFFFRESG